MIRAVTQNDHDQGFFIGSTEGRVGVRYTQPEKESKSFAFKVRSRQYGLDMPVSTGSDFLRITPPPPFLRTTFTLSTITLTPAHFTDSHIRSLTL